MLWLMLLGSLAGCASGGNFSLLGYTTSPQYDCDIKTVYVPMFNNRTFRKGLEFELTQAVVREIEAKTPYKVVSDPLSADTELSGTIVMLTKNILNRNQLNEVREAETVLGCEIVWRNLKTGEILSQPKAPGATQPAIPSMPSGSTEPMLTSPVPMEPGPPPNVQPLLVTSIGGYIPEIGGSMTTAQQQNVQRLATQIVSMMELPW